MKTTENTKKITKATLKSFIRKNEGNLYINVKSSFDGMVDCVMPCEGSFKKVNESDHTHENNLGIGGLWLVGGSGNYFQPYEDETYKGIEIYNCCGTSIIAIKKTEETQKKAVLGIHEKAEKTTESYMKLLATALPNMRYIHYNNFLNVRIEAWQMGSQVRFYEVENGKQGKCLSFRIVKSLFDRPRQKRIYRKEYPFLREDNKEFCKYLKRHRDEDN